MKKLLIATAALAMVAGTAQAQSSVTVYGIIDTGYNSLETTTAAGAKTTTSQIRTNGEASTSRFGLRGSEDLGGGMKANFVIESNIGNTNANNTAGSTNLGDRAFWAGLQDAKMGELRIGLQNAFTRDAWLGHDQLAAANVVGNLAHNGENAGAGLASTSSHTTLNTAVNYYSPRMSGVQLVVGLMQNDRETTTKAKTGSGSQVGLNYVAGKFSAAVAQVTATTDNALVLPVSSNIANATTCSTGGTCGSNDSAGTGYKTQITAATAANSLKSKDTAAAASYDFGAAKVAYIYNKRTVENGVSAVTTNNTERESHSFSASVPMSAKLVARVGYGFGDYKAATGSAAGVDRDISGYQAALNYNLSKRTTAYAIYGNEKRDTSATETIKAKEYSVGVRHSF